jgi:hypothetical protein
VLQELGGWSAYQMVVRYTHLSVSHVANYAESLYRRRVAVRTPSGTADQDASAEGS